MMMMRSSQSHPLNGALYLVRCSHYLYLILRSVTTGSSSAVVLQGEIKGFHQRFTSIIESTVECLEKCRIAVAKVVFLLTSILAVGEHKKFLEEKTESLTESKDHWILFGKLNLYWNPFSYSLFQGLLDNLTVRNKEFKEIEGQMKVYEEDMGKFRESTALVLFCHVAPDMLGLPEADPPSGFQKMVIEHQWPETVTLKDIEEFRKRFSRTYGLPQCAMMVNKIQRKCFEVTWFAVLPPEVVLALKKMEGTTEVFRDFKVISIEIDGECVYKLPPQLSPPVSLLSKNTPQTTTQYTGVCPC